MRRRAGLQVDQLDPGRFGGDGDEATRARRRRHAMIVDAVAELEIVHRRHRVCVPNFEKFVAAGGKAHPGVVGIPRRRFDAEPDRKKRCMYVYIYIYVSQRRPRIAVGDAR